MQQKQLYNYYLKLVEELLQAIENSLDVPEKQQALKTAAKKVKSFEQGIKEQTEPKLSDPQIQEWYKETYISIRDEIRFISGLKKIE